MCRIAAAALFVLSLAGCDDEEAPLVLVEAHEFGTACAAGQWYGENDIAEWIDSGPGRTAGSGCYFGSELVRDAFGDEIAEAFRGGCNNSEEFVCDESIVLEGDVEWSDAACTICTEPTDPYNCLKLLDPEDRC